MAGLVMSLPELFPLGLEVLDWHRNAQVTLTRKQCAALNAASFFNALPGDDHQCALASKERALQLPGFGFEHVLAGEAEKVLCLIAYFNKIQEASDAFLAETVTFARRAVDAKELMSPAHWYSLETPLADVCVIEEGVIEAAHGDLQADFANEYLGGGALNYGCVQEEIRFAISPECFVGMLFCEVMLAHEAIFIVGTHQYSCYKGYAHSFQFNGVNTEEFPLKPDALGRRGPHIVAFDALMCPGAQQYDAPGVQRELVKAYTACLGDPEESAAERRSGFATGNWGCGAFGGDPQLKALLQWLAASATGRTLRYFTFGDHRISELKEIVSLIKEKAPRCCDLYKLLFNHSPKQVFNNVRLNLREPQ